MITGCKPSSSVSAFIVGLILLSALALAGPTQSDTILSDAQSTPARDRAQSTAALQSAPVLHSAASGSIIFFDDFNDGNANGWTTTGPGTWYVENGEYVVDMGTGYNLMGVSLAGDPTWTDYIYDVDIMGEVGVDRYVVARYMDDVNNYWVDLRGVFNDVLLGKSRTIIASAPYNNYNGIWYHLEMILQGSRIQVYINGELLIDYDDVGTTITRGKIGLTGWTGAWGSDKVRYDNVVVLDQEGWRRRYLPLVLNNLGVP